jgi:hypothetical protein
LGNAQTLGSIGAEADGKSSHMGHRYSPAFFEGLPRLGAGAKLGAGAGASSLGASSMTS